MGTPCVQFFKNKEMLRLVSFNFLLSITPVGNFMQLSGFISNIALMIPVFIHLNLTFSINCFEKILENETGNSLCIFRERKWLCESLAHFNMYLLLHAGYAGLYQGLKWRKNTENSLKKISKKYLNYLVDSINSFESILFY